MALQGIDSRSQSWSRHLQLIGMTEEDGSVVKVSGDWSVTFVEARSSARIRTVRRRNESPGFVRRNQGALDRGACSRKRCACSAARSAARDDPGRGSY